VRERINIIAKLAQSIFSRLFWRVNMAKNYSKTHISHMARKLAE
jgi:hypothetical protein